MYSSNSGVAPRPLISVTTSSPLAYGRSLTTCSTKRSTTSSTGCSASRDTPGSPWWPTPTSISSSASSNVGLPAAGTVQGAIATPIVRAPAFTFSAIRFTSANASPRSAIAPQHFQMRNSPDTPRRISGRSLNPAPTSSVAMA